LGVHLRGVRTEVDINALEGSSYTGECVKTFSIMSVQNYMRSLTQQLQYNAASGYIRIYFFLVLINGPKSSEACHCEKIHNL